jgi:class 3 adenylate cyclase/tetratricopeptide (TPR) repeat protein
MTACPACSFDYEGSFKFCPECGTKLETAPVREERKVITALFCDLVGSTALGERLDAEDISRLLRDYQAICRKRIESHGGVVEKFIGDAVVGVFGVPLAHEDDPERAVRAALRITGDIAASDLGIEVRIGVNTGEALVRLDTDPRSGEGFATGDAMNTAARLEAAAPVMGVAVGAATHRGSEGAIVYEELPPISAKGKAELVPAWRALHPLSRIGAEERDRTPFVGRDLELQVLTQLSERSRSRPSTEFVTIIAEAGLGKSRLVRELARSVDALPELITWREGRCLPYGDGISFWALGEIVKAQSGILETDDQEAISSKLDRTITGADPQTREWIKDRLAPLVGLETSTEPPQREEAFTAWRRFLEQIAGTGPAVLVVEDLHWADEAFVAFLGHLAERTAGLPLTVLVTARPEVEERHPSWPPGRRSTVLSLSPLSDEDLEALITQSLPGADPQLMSVVLERAGGSPLYAEQLAAMLRERVLPIAGGALDETLIPQSVQALIAARIDALPPEPKRVLMAASVVGKTFWAGALSSLGEHEDLEATLGELVRREFCRPVHPSAMEGDAEFSFWHVLVRDVAYAELTRAERAKMHAATARWIAGRTAGAMGEDAEIVVHHLDAALELAPSAPELDTEQLTEFLSEALITAGEAAFRTDAAAADRLLERGLEFLDGSSPAYIRAVALRGRSLMMAGRPGDALPLLEEAFDALRLSHEHGPAVNVVVDLFHAFAALGRSADSAAVERELLLELGPSPSSAKAALLGVLSMKALGNGREDEASSLCGEGVAACDELGLPPPATLLNARGTLKILAGDLEGERDVREAARLFLDQNNPSMASATIWNLGASLSQWNGAASSPIVEEAIELSADRGVGGVDAMRIHYLFDGLFEGRWDALDEVAVLARGAFERGHPLDESIALLSAGYLEMERTGSLADTSRLLQLTDGWDPEYWVASFGAALLTRSSGPEARGRGLELLHRIADAGAGGTWRFLFEEVRAAIAAGHPDLARRLAADPELFDRPGSRADADAAAAAVSELNGDWEEAAARYAAAGEALERLGYFGSLVGPLIGLGRCLVQLGRPDDALSNLNQARQICERLGATVRVAEIDQLLSRTSFSDRSSA